MSTDDAKKAQEEFVAIKKVLRETQPTYPLPVLNETAAVTEPAIQAAQNSQPQ